MAIGVYPSHIYSK